MNNLTLQTRETVLPKQVFVIQRDKKKYHDVLHPITHLDQPPNFAWPTLASKELKTD